MNSTNPTVPIPGQAKSPAGEKTFRLGKVLMVVVPVAVLAVAALVLMRFMDVEGVLGSLARPKLVPASGQVLFQGKPLLNAQITTYPVSGRGLPALGWTDEEGKFTLKTDIEGNYVEGATAGEHRVTVAAYQPASGPGAPALLTPQPYAAAGTSPLRITIGSNPTDNEFQFVLEGEVPGSAQGAAQADGKTKGKRKAKSKAPSAADPPTPDAPTRVDPEPAKDAPETAESEPKADSTM